MLILQKSLAYGTTQWSGRRNEEMESNQPSCAKFSQFTGQSGVTLESLSRDHHRDPQDQRMHEQRGGSTSMPVISGKLLSFVCFSWENL